MTPEPGKFLVTIRVERADGQFATSSRLVPDDLLSPARRDPELAQGLYTEDVARAFGETYRRATELPE